MKPPLKIYEPPSDELPAIDQSTLDASLGRFALLLLIGASLAAALWMFAGLFVE